MPILTTVSGDRDVIRILYRLTRNKFPSTVTGEGCEMNIGGDFSDFFINMKEKNNIKILINKRGIRIRN